MSIRTDLGRTSIHGAIQKLGISVINPVRRDIGGGGNSPKDLRSSRHAVNHSLSKLLGKSIDSPTGAVSIGPRSDAQMEKYWRRRERQVKTRKFSNEFADLGGGGGSRTLKMSIWQLIDAAVFTGQLIERIPLPLPNRFLWCSPKRPENHSSSGVLAARGRHRFHRLRNRLRGGSDTVLGPRAFEASMTVG